MKKAKSFTFPVLVILLLATPGFILVSLQDEDFSYGKLFGAVILFLLLLVMPFFVIEKMNKNREKVKGAQPVAGGNAAR
ncbi:hypothetical protein G0Q06_05590 [Puniceicoccales bacterium CK1056]|uniref:Uncharacterized protein n=1 Tax=Oceanipulchritudo coccoides TaxID=2706888 RepID=A0A6B2M0N5_9BACT|nr:hypothetical protein [Oceanipulchritudo coccoides]NDV60827.1 hypothetical protein [Oceanipulchritudo coccoides]NDV61916.1 hypothetical protein [Oceanipulchritudo coccoides]